MKKILILTVGGSHQPLLTSINTVKSDKVFFICSQKSCEQVIDEDKVLKSSNKLNKNDLPNLVTLAELKDDQYEIIQIDEDDLTNCYRTSYEPYRSSTMRILSAE